MQSADGYSMPQGCYVGVRVGDVLKQGRYEPSRSYHFPCPERRRNAKIDIYQHVGSCIIAVDPDATSAHEVKVCPSSDPNAPEMKLKVNVSSSQKDAAKQREARTKKVKHQAQDYLTRYNIEEKLSEAVKALLKEQPGDPTAFLCTYLTGAPMSAPTSPTNVAPQAAARSEPAKPAKPVQTGASPARPRDSLLTAPFTTYYAANVQGISPGWAAKTYQMFPAAAPRLTPKVSASKGKGASKAESEEVAALRNKARDVLVKASGDGGLVSALKDVRTTDPKKAGASNEFQQSPSVGTWLTVRQPGDGPKQGDDVAPYKFKPSVGSWLMCLPIQKE